MRTFTCTGMKERWNSSAVLSNTSRSTTRSGYISRWIIAPPRGVSRSVGQRDLRIVAVEEAIAWHSGAFFEAWLRGPMAEKSPPGQVVQGEGAPSARRRPSYPLVSCAPAELTSVSLGNIKVSQEPVASQGQAQRSRVSGPGGLGEQ